MTADDNNNDKKPSIADLIAETPSAQPLDQALASIAARRARLLADDTKGEGAAATAPPEPDDWADRYTDADAAKAILEAAPPPKPAKLGKPRLIVDNDKPDDDNPKKY